MRKSLNFRAVFVVLAVTMCFGTCLGRAGEDSYEMKSYADGLKSEARCKESLSHPPQTPEEISAAAMSSDLCMYPTESSRFGVGLFEGLAKIRSLGKVGYINQAGKIEIPARFDEGGRFSEGLARVLVGGKWGFIDRTGRLAIPPQFEWACSFFAGRALVTVADKWGYINKRGEIVIKPRFDHAWSFSEGLAAVQIDEGRYKTGYIDTNGNWILKPTFDGGRDFHDGLAIVGKDTLSDTGAYRYTEDYVITRTGRRLFENPSWYVTSYSEGRLLVANNDRWFGFLDLKGRLVIPYDFEHAESFSEGLALVRTDDKWVYINRQGHVVLRPRARCLGAFLSGLAQCENEGKFGFIDRTGQFVIKPKFDWADGFRGAVAPVFVGDKSGYINRKGQYVWEPTS